MSTPYMQTRYVLDAHSGATSGPVRVSYFDPRTGEPCATKPEPLHRPADREEAKRKACGCVVVRANRRGKPVLVDGVRYETIAAAARSIGVDKTSLGAAIRSGAVEYGGRSVRYADGPAPAGGKRVMKGHFKRPVTVDGVRYGSLGEAAQAAGCVPATIVNALKAGRDKVKGHAVAYA